MFVTSRVILGREREGGGGVGKRKRDTERETERQREWDRERFGPALLHLHDFIIISDKCSNPQPLVRQSSASPADLCYYGGPSVYCPSFAQLMLTVVEIALNLEPLQELVALLFLLLLVVLLLSLR